MTQLFLLMGQILKIPIPGHNGKTDRCRQREDSRLHSTDGLQQEYGNVPQQGESRSIKNRGAGNQESRIFKSGTQTGI